MISHYTRQAPPFLEQDDWGRGFAAGGLLPRRTRQRGPRGLAGVSPHYACKREAGFSLVSHASTNLSSRAGAGLHLATNTGAIGADHGRAGAIVALVLGPIGMVLGGLARARSRRTA